MAQQPYGQLVLIFDQQAANGQQPYGQQPYGQQAAMTSITVSRLRAAALWRPALRGRRGYAYGPAQPYGQQPYGQPATVSWIQRSHAG